MSHIRNRQHELSRAFTATNKVSSNKLYLPDDFFLFSRTTLFTRASAKAAAGPSFYAFGMAQPGFEPTTSRSRSGRSTSELSELSGRAPTSGRSTTEPDSFLVKVRRLILK